MNTVSYQFHIGQVNKLEGKMKLQRFWIFLLLITSFYSSYEVHTTRASKGLVEIQAFKVQNASVLKVLTKKEDIERRRHYEEAINLLEIRLTEP
jgi:hypothetical protein